MTLAMAKARANKTFIVQASLTIVKNIFTVQATDIYVVLIFVFVMEASVFVFDKPYQPGLIFAGKARNPTLKCRLLHMKNPFPYTQILDMAVKVCPGQPLWRICRRVSDEEKMFKK
jgi:hypothetical protein